MNQKKNKHVHIRVTSQFLTDLEIITDILNTSKSEYIIDIVSSALERHKELLENVLRKKIK